MIEQAEVCGDHPAYLGTRGLDELRQHGKPMRLEILHKGDETDGKRVFLRAADEEAAHSEYRAVAKRHEKSPANLPALPALQALRNAHMDTTTPCH